MTPPPHATMLAVVHEEREAVTVLRVDPLLCLRMYEVSAEDPTLAGRSRLMLVSHFHLQGKARPLATGVPLQ